MRRDRRIEDLEKVVNRGEGDCDKKKEESDVSGATDRRFKQEMLASQKQDRLMRKEYADRIYTLISGTLTLVFFILILGGVGIIVLDASVYKTLLGTATVNVLALMAIIVRYLFPKH